MAEFDMFAVLLAAGRRAGHVGSALPVRLQGRRAGVAVAPSSGRTPTRLISR